MTNFNKVYEKIYLEWQPLLEELQSEAKKEATKKIILLIAALITFICGTGSVFGNSGADILFIIVALVIFSISIFGGSKKIRAYTIQFKEKIITAIVKSYSEDFRYSPNSGIASSVYIDGEFERFDRYHSEDGIVGSSKQGYRINMSEVHTEDKYRDSDGHVHYTTLFHGIFAKVEIDKFLSNKIRIRRNTIKIFDNNQRIEMDSSEFEKIYDIYSDNKIVTMQLFTSDILQMFIDFKDIKPELTIKENKLYIRFETGNIFEANVFKNALDYNTLKRYYDIVGFILKIADSMHNNIKETEL